MKKVIFLIVFTIVIFVTRSAIMDRQPAREGTRDYAPDASRLSRLLGENDNEGFELAIEPRDFSFPRDHGPHRTFRNEWWYLTGNLDGPDNERFGYELTIFRFGLPQSGDRSQVSDWASDEVFIGHFAVTEVRGERFRVARRSSRGSLGLAGAQADPLQVWVEDWRIEEQSGLVPGWRLRAADADIAIDLTLVASKPPVLQGREGLSRKSAGPGNASYYYSISRLQTNGSLRAGTREYAVSGQSWLDREWSSSALSEQQSGWDWFALQLDDGSELMFYQLRRLDGSPDDYSAGTWIGPRGESVYLAADDVHVVPTGVWDSPRGGRYPMGWRIDVPGRGLALTVTPVIPDQELATAVRYWEGAVDIEGSRDQAPVSGRGYVELTGYAAPAAAQ